MSLAGADKRLTEGQEQKYEWTFKDIKWRNTIVLTWLHIATVYSFFDLPRCGLTYILQFIILLGAAFGVTAGSHRYFTHRCYRANSALKYFLIFLQTLSAQEDIIKWVRDHRVHHKFTDTDADPHNSKRGFFFSHCGWLLIKKHPDVKTIGAKVDMSDLDNDPALLFQRKWVKPLCNVFRWVNIWKFPQSLHVHLDHACFRSSNPRLSLSLGRGSYCIVEL